MTCCQKLLGTSCPFAHYITRQYVATSCPIGRATLSPATKTRRADFHQCNPWSTSTAQQICTLEYRCTSYTNQNAGWLLVNPAHFVTYYVIHYEGAISPFRIDALVAPVSDCQAKIARSFNCSPWGGIGLFCTHFYNFDQCMQICVFAFITCMFVCICIFAASSGPSEG